MTGQITTLPLELVVVVVAASMVAGAVDIVRQPGWAWKRAEESKAAYLILDLILPVIGLAVYAFGARPKVIAERAGGSAVDTGAEPRPADAIEATAHVEPVQPVPTAVPDRFTGFQEVAGNGHPGPWETEAAHDEPESFEISSTFFSTGAATRTVRHPLALARAYRPKQRTSLSDTESERGAEAVGPPEAATRTDPQTDVVVQPEAQIEPVRAVVPEAAVVTDPTSEPAEEEEAAHGAQPAPELPELALAAAPTVPSGWKVDPTGRHQFRYWDGSFWTENVADDGDESRDAVSA